MKTVRCFLAIKLDIETVRSISKSQADLVSHCKKESIKVRWVPPPNMHVTIRFLGQITEPMAYALKDMLDSVTSAFPPFELTSAGLGVFPDISRPRVVFVGCTEGTNQAENLHAQVSERLVGAGFQFDNKPFRSHVTIGRVKSGRAENLAPLLTEGEPIFGQTFVRNLYCYQSDLTPKGAEYHSMWTLPLLGGTRPRKNKPYQPPERIPELEADQVPQQTPVQQPEPVTEVVVQDDWKGEQSDDDNAG